MKRIISGSIVALCWGLFIVVMLWTGKRRAERMAFHEQYIGALQNQVEYLTEKIEELEARE